MKKTLNIEVDFEAVVRLIDEMDLKSKSRLREKVYGRFIVYKYLRNYNLSLDRIGKFFNRDHSTVLHGLKQYELLSEYRYKHEDFDIVKNYICEKLGISTRLVLTQTLKECVLACEDFYQMRLLQEELKKTMQVA
jgi:hypothetical protein